MGTVDDVAILVGQSSILAFDNQASSEDEALCCLVKQTQAKESEAFLILQRHSLRFESLRTGSGLIFEAK